MRLDEFNYSLPVTAIAQEPLGDRPSARMLVDIAGQIEHSRVWDLPNLLGQGDLLVLNDTRVLSARLPARRASGGISEILFLQPAGSGHSTWEALVKPSRKIPPGSVLTIDDHVSIHVQDDLGDGRRIVEVEAPDGVVETLEHYGQMPLPPYVSPALDDPERYQTVYSRRAASAAAPTAGLHFTEEVLERCRAAGVQIEKLELVVGLDTFRPVGVEDLGQHQMHSEAYTVPETTLNACLDAKRVVAVGTTTTRALEAAVRTGLSGRTKLFIRRPFDFNVVDLLLTNFHLPRTTLLVMLDAFMGPRWRDLYALAIAEGYRFLSFGDAMLVDRETAGQGGPIGSLR